MGASTAEGTAALQTIATDALLVKALWADRSQPGLGQLLEHLQAALPGQALRLQAASGIEQAQLYAYLWLEKRTPVGKALVTSLEQQLKKALPQLQDISVSRLEKVFATGGASAGETPVFHYAVEMDPETGWMPELSQWYDTEHMPGLATVPGCVRATRLLNHDHGPLSLACYDLVTQETLGSGPWLAVRGTEWSSRMRPRFTNTIRTMFRSLPARG
ncbi:MAG: hypothetical protein V4614_08415 [Pseudomonadota bacterium]